MATTRSMSGATNKFEQKSKPKPKQQQPKGRVQKSKPKPKKQAPKGRVRTIKSESFDVFMAKDYVKRFPRPEPKLLQQIALGGHAEWAKMSNAEQDVWIKYTKEMQAQGFTLWAILDETHNLPSN